MAEWLHIANDLIESSEASKTASELKSDAKTELNKQGVFEILQDPDTYATVLLCICLINYGDETFKVEPIVLFQWLKEDFGTELHEDNENKLQALLVALTTDFFFTDLDVFQNICKTLSSGDPEITDTNFMSDPVTIPEVMWGIYEVSLNSEDTIIDNMPFSKQIDAFIDNTLDNDVDEQDDDTISPQTNNIVADNVSQLKEQLSKIGISDIPKFPTIEL